MDDWLGAPEGRWTRTLRKTGWVFSVLFGVIVPAIYVMTEPHFQLFFLLGPWFGKGITVGQAAALVCWWMVGRRFGNWSRAFGYVLLGGAALALAESVIAAPVGLIWLMDVSITNVSKAGRALLELTPVGLLIVLGWNGWKALDESL